MNKQKIIIPSDLFEINWNNLELSSTSKHLTPQKPSQAFSNKNAHYVLDINPKKKKVITKDSFIFAKLNIQGTLEFNNYSNNFSIKLQNPASDTEHSQRKDADWLACKHLILNQKSKEPLTISIASSDPITSTTEPLEQLTINGINSWTFISNNKTLKTLEINTRLLSGLSIDASNLKELKIPNVKEFTLETYGGTLRLWNFNFHDDCKFIFNKNASFRVSLNDQEILPGSKHEKQGVNFMLFGSEMLKDKKLKSIKDEGSDLLSINLKELKLYIDELILENKKKIIDFEYNKAKILKEGHSKKYQQTQQTTQSKQK